MTEATSYPSAKARASSIAASESEALEFTVLMSLYHRESPKNLREALDSLVASTMQPAEVVMVIDGPIGIELSSTLDAFESKLNIRKVQLEKNVGLAKALNAGIRASKSELIARFDTDDLCLPDRFNKQLEFLNANPNVVALGCGVEEFDPYGKRPSSWRLPPLVHESLRSYAKISSPLSHPAVMYRKGPVLSVGGYPESEFTVAFEDYLLWVKLIQAGGKLANLKEVLVRMRAGNAQARRRRGFVYAKQEVLFARTLLRLEFFSYTDFIRFVLFRTPFRFIPSGVLALFYQGVVRSGFIRRHFLHFQPDSR